LFRGKWNAALASSPQSAEPVVPDRPRIWPAFDLQKQCGEKLLKNSSNHANAT